MTTHVTRVGDVFSLPVHGDLWGYGQVVATYGQHNYYFAVFEKIHRSKINFNPTLPVDDSIAFLALSLDVLLEIGRWRTLATASLPEHLPLPAYRKSYAGEVPRVEVVDFSGKLRRPSTSVEASLLPSRVVVAPIRLEKAFKALHGLVPWDSDYDRLRPTNLTTARFFEREG